MKTPRAGARDADEKKVKPDGCWELADWDDLPERFTDPRCDEFMTACSGGFEGDISIGSAFVHKPDRYPQCFPDGAEGDACCTRVLLRRRQAGGGLQ